MNHNKIPTFKDLGIDPSLPERLYPNASPMLEVNEELERTGHLIKPISIESIYQQLEQIRQADAKELILEITGNVNVAPTLDQYREYAYQNSYHEEIARTTSNLLSQKHWDIKSWECEAMRIFKAIKDKKTQVVDYLTMIPPAPATEEEKAMYSRMVDLAREMPMSIHAMKSNREYAADVAFRNPVRGDTLLPVFLSIDIGPGTDFDAQACLFRTPNEFFKDWSYVTQSRPRRTGMDIMMQVAESDRRRAEQDGLGSFKQVMTSLSVERKEAKAEIIRGTRPMQGVYHSTGITSSMFYNPPQRSDHVFDETLFPAEPTPENRLLETIQSQLEKLATGKSLEYIAEQINNDPAMQALFTEAVVKSMLRCSEEEAKKWLEANATKKTGRPKGYMASFVEANRKLIRTPKSEN